MLMHARLFLVILLVASLSQLRAEDESLTPDEYTRVGMPECDHEWTAENITNAAKMFPRFSAKKQLPRFKSDRSGPLFERIVSVQNFAFVSDKGQSPDARFKPAVKYYSASTDIVKVYQDSFSKGDVRDTEMIELLGMQLRLTVALQNLTDELIVTLDKQDPAYPVRIQNLGKIREYVLSIISATTQALAQRDAYRAEELAKLIGFMKETFPKLVTALQPENKTTVVNNLTQMQKGRKFKDLQPGFDEFVNITRDATK